MTEASHTPGPWGYVPSNEHHGPYVVNQWGSGDICDCYTMSNLNDYSVRNGGDSKPIHFQRDEADANARLIAAAPDMLEALELVIQWADGIGSPANMFNVARSAIAKATGAAS